MFSPANANTDILAQNVLHYSGLSIEEIKCSAVKEVHGSAVSPRNILRVGAGGFPVSSSLLKDSSLSKLRMLLLR